MLFLINQSCQELIMVHDVWILLLSSLKVFIRHDLEDEAEDACEELGGHLVVGSDLGWINLLVDEVDNVHLKIH